MDALDAIILRQLGVEAFAGRANRAPSLRASDVARSLGRRVRLVQDRITRMEESGVIAGYALMPNPRHLGMALTTTYVPTPGAAGEDTLRGLADVDGCVMALAYLGEGICFTMSHGSVEERDRRLAIVGHLAASPRAALTMYQHDLPQPPRTLTPLDWRIIAAFAPEPKRHLADVADELNVTLKTVRTRLARMREEGSVDEIALVDFSKMAGVMPFEIAVWCDDTEAVLPHLLRRLHEHYWVHFRGPPGGYCDILVRVFTTTPAEAHAVVQAAASVPGVSRAEALMAAAAHADPRWLQEAIRAQVAATSTL